MKTFVPQEPAYNERQWTTIDAADKPLGRLAVLIANALRGKNTRTFDPSVDTGAFVVVTNAAKVLLTGRKDEQKTYQTYSGYRGGQKTIPVATMRDRHPDRIIRLAVWGMLPKNNLSKKVMTRLKVYAGAEHPHAAQKPTALV